MTSIFHFSKVASMHPGRQMSLAWARSLLWRLLEMLALRAPIKDLDLSIPQEAPSPHDLRWTERAPQGFSLWLSPSPQDTRWCFPWNLLPLVLSCFPLRRVPTLLERPEILRGIILAVVWFSGKLVGFRLLSALLPMRQTSAGLDQNTRHQNRAHLP